MPLNTRKKQTNAFWLLLFVLLAVSILVAVQPTHADGLPLPPRPVLEAPPPPGPGESKPVGGWIQLQAQGAADATQWSDVEWQDGVGEWHKVESWTGQYDQVRNGVGIKTWWVDRYTFGPTPFRWAISDSTGKNVLVTSATFNLPTQNQQTVIVMVSLPK